MKEKAQSILKGLENSLKFDGPQPPRYPAHTQPRGGVPGSLSRATTSAQTLPDQTWLCPPPSPKRYYYPPRNITCETRSDFCFPSLQHIHPLDLGPRTLSRPRTALLLPLPRFFFCRNPPRRERYFCNLDPLSARERELSHSSFITILFTLCPALPALGRALRRHNRCPARPFSPKDKGTVFIETKTKQRIRREAKLS